MYLRAAAEVKALAAAFFLPDLLHRLLNVCLNRAPSRPFCCVQRQTPQRDIAQIAKLPMPKHPKGKSPGLDL
jgi:hypothetical protein